MMITINDEMEVLIGSARQVLGHTGNFPRILYDNIFQVETLFVHIWPNLGFSLGGKPLDFPFNLNNNNDIFRFV